MECTGIEGCTDPEATNYWAAAGYSCADNDGDGKPDCCLYDNFLHFPWGDELGIQHLILMGNR